MDIKQIQELIKFVSRSGVNEVAIEQENFKITIKTNQAPVYVNAALPAPVASAPATQASAPTVEIKSTPSPEAEDNSKYITIKSPMIGTFYRRASPDKPLMAEEGTAVAPGKVVCIIEAMKLFNEIESEVKGTIVKILVDDASPVEYDQPLFLVQPE